MGRGKRDAPLTYQRREEGDVLLSSLSRTLARPQRAGNDRTVVKNRVTHVESPCRPLRKRSPPLHTASLWS